MFRPLTSTTSSNMALARTAARMPTAYSARASALTLRGFQTFASQQQQQRGPLRSTQPLWSANPQSGKPASDSWSHTAQNIKEEAQNVRHSVESAVAGQDTGGKTKGEQQPPDEQNGLGGAEIIAQAKSITSEMAVQVPQPALVWGAAGVLPYAGTAGASIYLARQANRVSQGLDASMDMETASALLLHAQNIQVAYGAIILSFLGAIHWGFEWGKVGGRQGHIRYAMGVAPLMLAWPTLLLGPHMALISQWAAYVTVWFIDLRATTAGWAPRWYSTYRFWLTAAVGSSIILTLAGTNYYDVSPSRSSQNPAGSKLAANVKQKTAEVRATASDNKGTMPIQEQVGGDVTAEQGGEGSDSFVKIDNPKRRKEEEEKKKKEEEEKKKKKEEEEKKKKEEEEKKKEEENKEESKEKEQGSEGEKKEGEGGDGGEKKDE